MRGPAPPPETPPQADPGALPDGLVLRGLVLSGALHVALGAVLVFGLPTLFSPAPPRDEPIAVQLVDLGPQTRATHPNPAAPRPEAKPDVPVPNATSVKPEPKPEAPRPAPPPSAAAAPAPPAPTEPKPAPPKPAPTPIPAPLPPQPKPMPPQQLAALEPKPAAPPLEKVDVPKPREKPVPPKQTAKAEPKAQHKKYDPGQFDALLKNLAAEQDTLPSEAPPQQPPRNTAALSAQPHAPLGSQLSASEMDMVREQIARCWNIPAGARDAKDLVVEIRVAVDPDGDVRQATIVDQARAARDPFFRAAAESARRAFFNPQCRPLRLPPDKYAIWKDLVVDFSPKDVL